MQSAEYLKSTYYEILWTMFIYRHKWLLSISLNHLGEMTFSKHLNLVILKHFLILIFIVNQLTRSVKKIAITMQLTLNVKKSSGFFIIIFSDYQTSALHQFATDCNTLNTWKYQNKLQFDYIILTYTKQNRTPFMYTSRNMNF